MNLTLPLLDLLTSPYGRLAIVGAGILFGFLAWRVILGKSYSRIGLWPLVVGYLFLMAVVLVTSLVFAGLMSAALHPSDFSFANLLFFLLLGIDFLMPGLGFLGVPLAAFIVRTDRLNFWTAALFVLLMPLAIGTLRWSLGLEFPITALSVLVLVVAPAIAFISGVMISAWWRQ